MKENEASPREPLQQPRPRKVYSAPAIICSFKVEARAVLCSKAEGSCTLGPTSS